MSRPTPRAARTAIPPLLWFGCWFGWMAAPPLVAQEPAATAAKPTAPDAKAASPSPEGPFVAAEYGEFENLRGIALSADGRWLAVSIARVDEARSVRLVALATGDVEVLEDAASPVFSPDGRYLAWQTAKTPPLNPPKKPAADKPTWHVKDLVDGKTRKWVGVRSVEWEESGAFALMRRSGDDGALVVERMADGRQWAFAKVAQWAWADKWPLLALVCHHEDRLGNGLQVLDPSKGEIYALHSGDVEYSSLTWRDDAADLAVLAATDHGEDDDTLKVLAWKGVGRRPEAFEFDATTAKDVPEGLTVVADGGLRWADQGDRVFVGLREWRHQPSPEAPSDGDKPPKEDDEKGDEKADKTDDESEPAEKDKTKAAGADAPKAKAGKSLRDALEDPAGVEVWHSKDIDILPFQKRRLSLAQRRTHRAVWWLAEQRLVVLGDELTETVDLDDQGLVALGLDNTPYETEKRFGPTRHDVYHIDQKTGAKRLLLEGVKIVRGTDPKGRYLIVHQGGALRSVHLTRGSTIDLTGGLDGDFVADEGNQLTDEPGGFGVAGWSHDGRWLFVHSRYDVWRLRPDGSNAERLTAGREAQVRYRLLRLDREAEYVDAEGPWAVSIYGDLSKESGYGTARPGRALQVLRQDGAHVSQLTKSQDADVYAWVEERFDRPPQVFTAGTGLRKPTARVRTNPHVEGRPWGRSELVSYENTRGETLQGALFYPANYEAGRQYPMITYIYELRSQMLHRFQTPSETSPYNTAVFSQAGYFVFQPDITYRAQNPGVSAVECVVPAVRKVLESGMVDPARVGLVGHSWGAYQTAFLATQTDIFAACVAGAPLTNMMSMSMSIYWNSGQTDAWIFHESQGRMDRPFWNDVDTYIANSPIFHVDRMKTPLLVAFGDDDGAVDFNQGVELYNAARLVQAPMVMLVYPGENHSLRQKPNQVDYHWRVREWFDHYLQGAPAPKWITEGQPWLDRTRELEDRERRDKPKDKAKGAD